MECILCALRDDDERVVSLKVYQDEVIFIVLNIYPYNIGHLMVCLNRHVMNFTELTKEEISHVFRSIQGLQLLLNDLYKPHGYNIGLNQGKNAGASIDHIHWHVVPRFPSELGYIDIVGNTRIAVEGLDSVKKKIENKIDKYLNPEFFENF